MLFPKAGLDGFWGPVTSTLDWCEENYTVSHFIAEFNNTLSNLNYIFLALVGLYSCKTVYSTRAIILSYLGVLVVGVGSFLFHMTLTYRMQLSDELPMIYCTLVCVHASIHLRSSKYSYLTASMFTIYSVLVTLIYIENRDPLFHEFAYGCTVILFFGAPIYQMNRLATEYSSRIPRLARMFATNALVFLAGFALWNIENRYCVVFREIKTSVGYPLRLVFELHSWWHFMTGYGSYGMVVHLQVMHALVHSTPNVDFKYVWGVPVVVDNRGSEETRKIHVD